MGYIIFAEADITEEINILADTAKVDARILSQDKGHITFDVHGNFNIEKQKQLTKALCETMIDAGFLSFRIGHSY
jgi:hypothetical protein